MGMWVSPNPGNGVLWLTNTTSASTNSTVVLPQTPPVGRFGGDIVVEGDIHIKGKIIHENDADMVGQEILLTTIEVLREQVAALTHRLEILEGK